MGEKKEDKVEYVEPNEEFVDAHKLIINNNNNQEEMKDVQ